MAHLTKDHANPLRWVVLYPVYLDAKKTVAEGRRLPLKKALDAPTLEEIKTALTETKKIGLKFALEDKCYPRDFSQRGRFRIQLRNTDGSLCNPAIPNRNAVFEAVADAISKTTARLTAKKEAEAAAKAQAAANASAAAAAASSSSGGGGGGKKKGKKGKK
eukprot:m.39957 g.39957  ORF g.39957 m.39957 type:complete len:161 (-) comp11829_c0_seq1:146-628(-)